MSQQLVSNPLLPYYCLLLLFLLMAFLISVLNKTRTTKHEHHNKMIDALNVEIRNKQEQLAKMDQEIINRTIDRRHALTNVEIYVLNMYDACGIKIPADILEELPYQRLSTEQQVYDYIENQRYHWKMENSKKPFKGALLNVKG